MSRADERKAEAAANPFDLDDVVEFIRPTVLDGEGIAAVMEPTDFNDPFGIVEGIGHTGRSAYIDVTMSNGTTYTVTDLDAFRKTGLSGEEGLNRAAYVDNTIPRV